MAEVKFQTVTDRYALYCDDCIKFLPCLEEDSIGFSIFSPPFADLYAYSDSDDDMGNCRDYKEFFVHFDFLVTQLFKVMMPGRMVAVHCMILPVHQNKEGYIGLKNFPGDIVTAFEKHGFIFYSHHTIWKDPLTAATRTHAIGLAHQQIVKDSAMSRMGIADQILGFMKPGDNPIAIEHPDGLTEYPGSTPIPRELQKYAGHTDPRTNKRSHWIWQMVASPVWTDIRETKVLPFRKGKDKDDQRHICPLQTDTIERCCILWSKKGDIVLSPFAGIGSEIYCAVQMGRRGIGIELKKSYYRQMKRNLESLKLKQEARKGFGV